MRKSISGFGPLPEFLGRRTMQRHFDADVAGSGSRIRASDRHLQVEQDSDALFDLGHGLRRYGPIELLKALLGHRSSVLALDEAEHRQAAFGGLTGTWMGCLLSFDAIGRTTISSAGP